MRRRGAARGENGAIAQSAMALLRCEALRGVTTVLHSESQLKSNNS